MTKLQNAINESMDETLSPIIKNITEEKLNLSRSVNFAGAGLSFAVIVALTTLPSLSILLEIALILFSVSIPLYVMMAIVAENFIWAGQKSYECYKRQMYNWKMLLSVLTAYLSSALALILVIFHLSFTAGILIVITSFLAYAFNSQVQAQLLDVLKSDE